MIIHHKSNWSLKFDVYFDWFECIHNTRESNLDKARLNTPILINRFYEFVAPDSLYLFVRIISRYHISDFFIQKEHF